MNWENQRPPITRQRLTGDVPTPAQDGSEEVATAEGDETQEMCLPPTVDHPATTQLQEEEDRSGAEQGDRHVVQFIRRHRARDVLRIGSSVLFATIGVVETQTQRTHETSLIRAIAGEICREKFTWWRGKYCTPLRILKPKGNNFNGRKTIPCRGGGTMGTNPARLRSGIGGAGVCHRTGGGRKFADKGDRSLEQ